LEEKQEQRELQQIFFMLESKIFNRVWSKIIKTVEYAHTHTYLLTYSMQQSPPWEANWASQEIPHILWNSFTSVCHLTLSWVKSSPCPTQPTSWRSILISLSHLCLGLKWLRWSSG
jgi:hypothetical protein